MKKIIHIVAFDRYLIISEDHSVGPTVWVEVGGFKGRMVKYPILDAIASPSTYLCQCQ